MDITSLTTLFGWMTVLNFTLLLISTLILAVFKTRIIRLHSHLTGVAETTLEPVYLYWLGFYKVLILVFNLSPYLALNLI